MPDKRCPRCGETKPVSEFHKDRHALDGKHGYCKLCTRRRRVEYYDRVGISEKDKFTSLRRRVAAKSMKLLISFEEFQTLRNQPCVYGGGTRPDIKVGIDRKDSSIGYTVKNCAPCCARHNLIKSDIFSHEEMLFIVAHVKSAKACGNGTGGRKRTFPR
jgi:hypothetical protein